MVLWEWRLLGCLAPRGDSLLSFLPEVEPERGHAAEVLSAALAGKKLATQQAYCLQASTARWA